MSFKMEYKIGNRKVSEAEWMRHIQEAPMEAAKDEMKSRIERIRCPKHGQSARVTVAKTSQGFDLKLSGCCDEVIQTVERALA